MQVNTREKIPIKKICYWLIIIMLALSLLFSFCFFRGVTYADSKYSDVLFDLQKDSNFDASEYPVNDNDYSLQVIQIAESVNKELFVYVYQPYTRKVLNATSVNMALATGDNAVYKNYDLLLLSHDSVFYKYMVENIIISDLEKRYYSISSIYRKFDYSLDKELDSDNTVDEVVYPVGKTFGVTTINDQLIYECEELKTVEITSKRLGLIRYSNSSNIYQKACDSHYIAFNTDLKIDYLLNASVDFVTRSYELPSSGGVGQIVDYVYGDPVNHNLLLSDIDEVTVSNGNLFANKYTWSRIVSTDNFIEDHSNILSDTLKDELKSKQWVFRFYETDYKRLNTSVTDPQETGTRVKEVTILQLQFRTDGIVYNLGVVDNKQTGPINPDGVISPELPGWLSNVPKILFWCLIGILAIVVLIPLFPFIIKAIVYIIKYLVLAIWYIIKYLALGIYWLFAWPFYLKK